MSYFNKLNDTPPCWKCGNPMRIDAAGKSKFFICEHCGQKLTPSHSRREMEEKYFKLKKYYDDVRYSQQPKAKA